MKHAFQTARRDTEFEDKFEDSSCSDSGSEQSISEPEVEDSYLAVRCHNPDALTEQDIVLKRCECLAATHLRDRPTLPAKDDNTNEPIDHQDLPMRLPLYHCPFKGCSGQWDSRDAFEAHFLTRCSDFEQSEMPHGHRDEIDEICGSNFRWMSPLDYVYGAVAVKERQRWPDASLAVARRSLRHLAERYNDETTRCIVCFVCGSQEVTLDNYNANEDKKPITYVGKKK